MKRRFPSYDDLEAHDFDAVIDVRSPAEFAEDHVPGAINLPVLDNAERARVGTIYKQESPFRARKIGAALVFRNAALHIENRLAGHEGGWRPLVYCWRGGQRSGAFTWMLREIGWRAEVIEGGYKTYRRLVSQRLYEERLPHRLVQVGGHTGTAKTALLPRLAARGVQVLDLEGLARHRGSLLGGLDVGQPSQKAFESALAAALSRLDPRRPVVVEAESSKIGSVNLPPSVWAAMLRAPWLMVEAPIEARARYLAQAYDDVLADGEALKARLAPLRHFRGGAVVERWSALIDGGDTVALCHALAEDHYDPAYDKSLQAVSPEIVGRFSVPGLGPDDVDRAADDMAAWLQANTI